MRRSTARRAAVVGSAVLLMFASAGAVAAADPADPAPSLPGLPAELVQAVQRDLHLTADQYLQRADLAQRVGSFAAIMREQFADAFGGAWLDDNGRAIVALTDSPSVEQARAKVEEAGFDVRTVAKTETALREQKSSFDAWLASQPGDVAQLVRSVTIDVVSNTIAVRVDHVGDGFQLPDFLDPARILVLPQLNGAEPFQAGEIASDYDRVQLGGGDAYASSNTVGSLRCSLGFNATDAGGAVVNVSAGHCDPDLPTAGTPNASEVFELRPLDMIGQLLGTFQKSSLDNHDYSIIRIADDAISRFQNNLVKVPGQSSLAIDGTAVPVVGAPACKSGARTGFSCGVVNSVDEMVSVGDRPLNNSFSVSICALPGDSGGAIVTGTKALGISSASTVADYPICEIPNIIGPLLGNAPTLFAMPVSVILAENPGLQLRTS